MSLTTDLSDNTYVCTYADARARIDCTDACRYAAGEPPLPREWVELVVSTASQAALAGTMGVPSEADQQLEETAALSLPLLLPEDGYSCDSQQEGVLRDSRLAVGGPGPSDVRNE